LFPVDASGIIARMCAFVLGILLGVCCLQWSAALPFWAGWGWLVTLVALAVAAMAGRFRAGGARARAARGLCLVAAFVAGYGWAAWRAELRMADMLDAALEGRDLLLTGVIASLPDDNGDSVRFEFEIEASAGTEGGQSVPRRVLLSWMRESGKTFASKRKMPPVPDLQPGERWRLPVRLRRPHGASAPGVFDYEAWLLERGLRATGTVRGEGRRLAADSSGFMHSINRRRGHIRHRFEQALPDAPHRGILVALAVGDQNGIGKDQWDILRRTGVQHLVAISGLHISLIAVALGGLCMLAWRRCSWLVLRCPARLAGAVAGLAAAIGYALLAGLGIPVQRALVMLTVAALSMIARRETGARNVLALALAAVLVFDPWAPLTAGFWLSFIAVAVILLMVGGRVRPAQGWRAAVRLQLAITLVTIPALAALFQGFSLASPLANAFAIPMVNFAIAPVTLLAALWPADWLLELAHTLTAWMMNGLQWLSALPFALVEQALPPSWLLAASAVAVVLLVLPRGTPGRLAALALLSGLFLWQPVRPDTGKFHAVVLDVGQGLAVHVQTARHDLLYDSGPAYRTSDAGERIVVPYLRAVGVRRLDMAMISHDDADHAGGLESLRARVGIGEIFAGDASAAPVESSEPDVRRTVYGTPCVAGRRWQWDGVEFAVLAPSVLSGKRRENEDSCVLRVQASSGASLLLTGDIGREAESLLVQQRGSGLDSTAIVAPHHGSRSSSSPAFVAAVRPGIAVFSSGYRNRYGHPHPQVLERWASAGAQNLRTDEGGAIMLDTVADGMKAEGWRARHPRYWHGR
jgi:competence protein ComEC